MTIYASLNDNERRFVEAYTDSPTMGNAIASYVAVFGGSERTGTLRKQAARMVIRPEVRAAIDQWTREHHAKLAEAGDRYGVTKAKLVNELATLAMTSMADFVKRDEAGKLTLDLTKPTERQLGAIKRLKLRADGSIDELWLYDRNVAALTLSRLQGYIVDRKDVRIIRGVEDLTDDELKALAGSMQVADAASAGAASTRH